MNKPHFDKGQTMNAVKLILELPVSDVVFLEEYATQQKTTIEELFDQFIKRLREIENYSFHSDIPKFAGVIPPDVNARKEYYEYLEEKHK